MGLSRELHKQAEVDLREARAKMERDNHAHMAALAKVIPEPTIETLHKAMGVTKNPETESEAVKPDVEKPAAVVGRTSEPEKPVSNNKGGYATRMSKPEDTLHLPSAADPKK